MPRLGPNQFHLTMMAPFHDGTQHLWWLRGTIACGRSCPCQVVCFREPSGGKHEESGKPIENTSVFWGESNALPRSLCFTCKVMTNLSEWVRTAGPGLLMITFRMMWPYVIRVSLNVGFSLGKSDVLFKMCLNLISYLWISEFCSDFNFENHGKVKFIIALMASDTNFWENSVLPLCHACPSKWPFLKLLSQWRLATHPLNSQIGSLRNQVRSTMNPISFGIYLCIECIFQISWNNVPTFYILNSYKCRWVHLRLIP